MFHVRSVEFLLSKNSNALYLRDDAALPVYFASAQGLKGVLRVIIDIAGKGILLEVSY